MLEYIFFDDGLLDKFVAFAREKGVEVEVAIDAARIVLIPEDLDDTLADEIDHYYEVLLQENAELLEGTEHALEKSVAGVRVELADGTPCTIRFDPDLLARVLQSISMEELRDMIQSIASQVEEPDDSPLCHTPKRDDRG